MGKPTSGYLKPKAGTINDIDRYLGETPGGTPVKPLQPKKKKKKKKDK